MKAVRKSMLAAALLALLAGGAAGAAEPAPAPSPVAVNVTVTQAEPAAPAEDVDLAALDGKAAFSEAVQFYEKACGLVAGTDRTDALTRGIGLVNRALEEDPGDTDAMILASRLYAARGAKAYAEEYRGRAETALKGAIVESGFQNLPAMLDYAILCYVDSRGEKQGTAENQARYILDTLAAHPEAASRPAAQRIAGVASLLLGKAEEALAYLDKGDPELGQLYRDTVARGRWLWLVRSDLAEREFLFYFLRQPDRYAGFRLTEHKGGRSAATPPRGEPDGSISAGRKNFHNSVPSG